mgnify:CR=1 FL=1
MLLLSPIKDHHSERRLFFTRVVFSASVAVLLLGIVVARLFQLQVVDYEHFAERSQGNRVRIEAVPPIRGLVFDRQGRVLAENLPAYQLELIPEQVDDIDDTLARLAALEMIEADDIPRIKTLIDRSQRFKPVTLRRRLNDEQIATFAIRRPRFPGVDFRPALLRHYPQGAAAAHAVGYVGAVSERDLQTLDPKRYAGSGITGKTGVEQSFESNLHGDSGYRHVVTNALGRAIPADSRDLRDSLPFDETPAPGANVYLSIDLDLQKIANTALEGRRGAVVAIDPWSGEVLALVSAPSFDPNLFAVGMTTSQYSELTDDLARPLFNRAVRGTYPPGSTIKPMLALAALETGATNLTRKNMCIGYFTLPNSTHRYRDWKPEGHGEMDLHDAISQSCDVYFYELSGKLGIDNMHYYLDQFGLGRQTGVDVSGESAGINPSREWKRQAFSNFDDKKWYHGETVISSIGQGCSRHRYSWPVPRRRSQPAASATSRTWSPHGRTRYPVNGRSCALSASMMSKSTTSFTGTPLLARCTRFCRDREARRARPARVLRTRWPARAAPHRFFRWPRKKNTMKMRLTNGCATTLCSSPLRRWKTPGSPWPSLLKTAAAAVALRHR